MMEDMEAQISTLTDSIEEVNIHQNYCPFCGAEQTRPKIEILVRQNVYNYCSCDAMREHRDKLNNLDFLKQKYDELSQSFELRKKKARGRLENTGIGKRFLEATFDSFDKDSDRNAYERALEYAQSFGENEGENIIFIGDVGTGKTHLAAAIANYIVDKFACSVEFWNYSEVLAEMRAAFWDETKDKNLESKMCNADLLVIDDLGKEKVSVFSNEVLYRVINYRYKEKLPIVTTTNADLDFLYESMGEAVFSRLVCICQAVKMQGINYRLKKLYY